MSLREWARKLKREMVALSLALRDPRTPWYARAWTAGVLAYALSPIDLIPDFIPILGQLDDLVIVPLGIVVAVRLVPPEVLRECRELADQDQRLPRNLFMGALFVALWTAGAALLAWKLRA